MRKRVFSLCISLIRLLVQCLFCSILSRWIPSNKPMKFLKYDSQLPQVAKANDPQLYENQRLVELQEKRGECGDDAFKCAPLLNMAGMPRTVSRNVFKIV